MLLRIQDRVNVELETVEDAVDFYEEERDSSGEGASTFPNGYIYLHLKGKVDTIPFKMISYNGQVWPIDRATGKAIM
jgi:hypothetical protein